VDGETIETTPEHPFHTADGEWVPAANLRVGDEVYRADGSYGIVEAISFVYRRQGMYNLTVEGAHTYFVGDGQWLVHNHCGKWVNVNESMSPRAAAYQSRITGRPTTQAYAVGGVKFDGFDGGALLEAKGPGYATFVRNGDFQPFFEGRQELLDQASRQLNAPGRSHSIIWHVAEPEAAAAMRKLLQDNGYGAIRVKHTP
jgi:hypothetical protein